MVETCWKQTECFVDGESEEDGGGNGQYQEQRKSYLEFHYIFLIYFLNLQ